MSELQNKDKIKQQSANLFPVVGVGASAGGLAAFKRLIKAIPENSGIAFILVQHLEPSHDSILSELLQRVTQIPVQEITNDVRVEPNHIYIIPSNKLLTASDGVLQLSPRPPKNVKNMPIDVFFTSLAEVHQSHAIGIVLSGTATDGTLGLKAIKDHGGITFAQDQQSAAFDGMPQSAIDADVVDFILSPEEIVLHLAKLKHALGEGAAEDDGDSQLSKDDTFKHVLSLLRVRKGADFTYYKQTTVRRRIIRRMGLNKIETISDYLSFLKNNKPEVDILYQDLLIPVTDFFRDPKAYKSLSVNLFPLILEGRDESNPLRIWIAGCSTGEEPYSIAMCLHEYLGDKAPDTKVQIFATDISEKSVTKARSGLYTKKDVASLSADRLQKYFTKVNGAFHINKFIRDMCVFACHNFLKDPPFAKMDLISCRNVLIYMESFLQKKALTTFHYALKENGYLLLGKSETTGSASNLFRAFNKHEKLYVRNNVTGKFLHVIGERNEKIFKDKVNFVGKESGKDDFQKNADDILLSKFTPPGVVVNEQMEIVQFRGSTRNWLEPPPGKPSLNVLKMAREGLAFEIRNALHKVKLSNKPFVKEDILLQFMGSQHSLTIEILPLLNTAEPYYLILFKDAGYITAVTGKAPKDIQQPDPKLKESAEKIYSKRLENELSQIREDMRSIAEDQEAVNEELQSANEELLSGSEELQSLNEELETSKEEIQSTNEELTTLNQELFDRNEQLNLSRIYAESIVATIREPLIILDTKMLVKTANKSYYDKFKITEEETEGKLFYDLQNGQWNIPELRKALDKILVDQKKIADFEIKRGFGFLGERIMLLNASRIYRKDDTEQLVLLAIEDITETKKLEAELQKFTYELENLVEERTNNLKEVNISLKNSNENLEQFATLASHDLREPMRKIMTFVNLLHSKYRSELKEDAKELLDKISLSAERMSALIKGVLNFSRITVQTTYEKTDLDKVLDHVITGFDLLITQKKAIINHSPLPVIEAIPLQISQLFQNLLGNALKFSKPGISPVITITSQIFPIEMVKTNPLLIAKLPYCEIIFHDKGIGFDSEFSKQIFFIFERLHSKEQFEGTGIGLALCKRIVSNHHGEIYAESNEEIGTAFHIILPIEQINNIS
jgi:two-component system, chemotaxis family, CheB/CheR fusion protein